jgi:hypothetical protein
MIISHEHRFIFIKTNKTGGTSIEAAISELCGPDDVITPFREDNEKYQQGTGPQNYRTEHPLKPKRPLWRELLMHPERYYHHSVGFYEYMPASRVRDYVGEEVWRSYFKFAFDRNPWDRQVSAYHFRYRRSENPPPFSAYMRRKRRAWINNYEIYSADNQPCVDFVGRFENLAVDFRKALKEVGLNFDQELPRAKANFRRSQKHYRNYYDDETRGIVSDWYAPEIRLLSYEF